MNKPKVKNPTIFIRIPLYIYPFNVILSINHTNEQLNTILRKKGIKENELELANYEEGAAKYVCFSRNNLALIRMKNLPRSAFDYGALAHETLHVVISIMRVVGMAISDNHGSDEAYTYLMSYLTSQVFLQLNKYY